VADFEEIAIAQAWLEGGWGDRWGAIYEGNIKSLQSLHRLGFKGFM